MAIFGVPWIASIIYSAVGVLIAFLAKFLTRTVAVRVGYVAAFLAMLTVFAAFIAGLMRSLVIILPEGYGVILPYVVPWSTHLCISAIIAARFGRWVLTFKDRVVRSIFSPVSM